ncbi:hypothetical protein Pmani_009998 [Petrolisthes manimaculis]|uniref:DBB domain-containing protein n=1 Tax=Petrolisthes manimaculis TaxID=1843537 RepID=A0AAE1Q3X8_9EUCA|nr:hypothetical protein Pmani_009998 [Petrolisthes manimaculis]
MYSPSSPIFSSTNNNKLYETDRPPPPFRFSNRNPSSSIIDTTTSRQNRIQSNDLGKMWPNQWMPSPPPNRYNRSSSLPLSQSSRSTSSGTESLQLSPTISERNSGFTSTKRGTQIPLVSARSSGVDIAILCASDGIKWTTYLRDVFSQLVPNEEGARKIRVESKNVEEIGDDIGQLQAVKLRDAKLQIVILSPCFLIHIGNHGKSELGQVFRPEKVLALLLGVEKSCFCEEHLSALYSFKDWHHLKVRNMDIGFVYEVLSEGIKILNKCELYSRYRDERNAKFKLTPRKITKALQQRVYILLDSQVKKSDVKIMIDKNSQESVMVKSWHMSNPYTIDFKMPEDFFEVSSILLISVLVNDKGIGSRQLKCESSLDTLKTVLDSVSNTTEFMCQALNINPTCDELDKKLSSAVKNYIPVQKLHDKHIYSKDGAIFPTWIHFSAFYGLECLTWSLLEVVGGESALIIPNCKGHTPSVLAYQRGFTTLAEDLEAVALVSALAAEMNYACPGQMIPSERRKLTREESYTFPPPPLPLPRTSFSNYDPVPSPRQVFPDAQKLGNPGVFEYLVPGKAATPEIDEVIKTTETENAMGQLSTCTPTPSPPPPPLPPPPTLSQAVLGGDTISEFPPPPSPISLRNFASVDTAVSTSMALVPYTSNIEPQMRSNTSDFHYIWMHGSTDSTNAGGINKDYNEQVNTLVAAWLAKTDIKKFVEEHKVKIVEIKSIFDTGVQRGRESRSGTAGEPRGREAEASIDATTTTTTRTQLRSDLEDFQQNSILDVFLDLMTGRTKNSQLLWRQPSMKYPNDYTDEPAIASPVDLSSCDEDGNHSITTHITMKEKSIPRSDFIQSASNSPPKPKSTPHKHKIKKQNSHPSASRLMRMEERRPVPPPRTSSPYVYADQINIPPQWQVEEHKKQMNKPKPNITSGMSFSSKWNGDWPRSHSLPNDKNRDDDDDYYLYIGPAK